MIDFEQWEGFEGRIWKEEVNVRDFIQKNYTPYDSLAGFFIYGEKGKERMVSLGFPAEKIHVIYNSLCARDEVPALRSSLKSDIYIKHFGNADPVLFFSGRLTSVKRIDMLLTAVIRLNAEGCHCNAVLVGDGAERQKLETMVSRAGLGDRVWFYGKCYDESHLAGLIYNADLCVSPGNSGLVAVHSMMYRLIVVLLTPPLIADQNSPLPSPIQIPT